MARPSSADQGPSRALLRFSSSSSTDGGAPGGGLVGTRGGVAVALPPRISPPPSSSSLSSSPLAPLSPPQLGSAASVLLRGVGSVGGDMPVSAGDVGGGEKDPESGYRDAYEHRSNLRRLEVAIQQQQQQQQQQQEKQQEKQQHMQTDQRSFHQHAHAHAPSNKAAAAALVRKSAEEEEYRERVHKAAIILHNYNQLPQYLQHNRFIHTGYRVFLSYQLCFRSLFLLHNESVNVWSHLLGAVMFFVFMLYDLTVLIPSLGGGWFDRLVYLVFIACVEMCMVCSALYHLFNCHSEGAMKRWLQLDFMGISMGMLGGYLPAVYYAFYCMPALNLLYTSCVLALTGVTFFFQVQPRFATTAWQLRRVLLYATTAVFGVVPVFHWLLLHGPQGPLFELLVRKVPTVYTIMMLGGFFYLSRFPESWFPGRVDYFGSSHQWWHTVVLVGFVYWYFAGLEVFQVVVATPCPPTGP